jgi:glycosyltransferase involved in cell wall biosynthesis
VERRLLEGAAAVHLFFPSEASALMALAPAARVVVAPTGIAIPDERWRGGGGYLAWIGRYDPTHKGLDLLVEALASLPPDRRPRVRLRGYDYRHGLDRLRSLVAAQPGLTGWIDVGGPISGRAKREFLLDADGYLLPSRWESHSVALLEALALGMPSLVSGTLHVAADLRRHQAAVLTMPDVEDLAQGLATVGGAGEMGDRARSMVATEFSWQGAVDDLVSQLATLGLIR